MISIICSDYLHKYIIDSRHISHSDESIFNETVILSLNMRRQTLILICNLNRMWIYILKYYNWCIKTNFSEWCLKLFWKLFFILNAVNISNISICVLCLSFNLISDLFISKVKFHLSTKRRITLNWVKTSHHHVCKFAKRSEP